MSIALSADGICKSFTYHTSHSMLQDAVLRRPLQARQRRLDVLQDATLVVRTGEWVGIYGPNGSGKTTFLRILAGLLPPDRGMVSVHGSLSLFLGLGAGFNTELAADSNIHLEGLLHGFSAGEIRSFADRIVEFAGLTEHRRMPLKYYSPGMLLRLAYAVASQADSDIYMFDELLAVGDVEFQAHCSRHLLNMRSVGKTVVLVSHSLPQLRMFCDRIETVREGRIVPLEVCSSRYPPPERF